MSPASSRRTAAVLLACLATAAPLFAAEEGVRSLDLPSVLVEDDPQPLLGLDLPPASYPLEPIGQLPFYGAKHGFVATTTGNLAFGITDLRLPGRMPIVFGRVYDSKLSASLPPPPPGGKLEARWTQDLGENWMLGYQAYLLSDGSGGYTMATPEGDLIEWVPASGSYFQRVGGAPSRHMVLQSNGPSSMIETQW